MTLAGAAFCILEGAIMRKDLELLRELKTDEEGAEGSSAPELQ